MQSQWYRNFFNVQKCSYAKRHDKHIIEKSE